MNTKKQAPLWLRITGDILAFIGLFTALALSLFALDKINPSSTIDGIWTVATYDSYERNFVLINNNRHQILVINYEEIDAPRFGNTFEDLIRIREELKISDPYIMKEVGRPKVGDQLKIKVYIKDKIGTLWLIEILDVEK